MKKIAIFVLFCFLSGAEVYDSLHGASETGVRYSRDGGCLRSR